MRASVHASGGLLILTLAAVLEPECARSAAAVGHRHHQATPVSVKAVRLPHAHNLLKDVALSNGIRRPGRRPRCGVPDFPDGRQQRLLPLGHRRRRFVLYGGRLDKNELTYRIVRFPWQLGEEKVRRVFREALKIWSDVTPLTFTEVRAGKADIRIDFTRYWHGDSLPFDGPGGILAHAFFPKTHRQGDVHFDYDEAWTLGNHMGTDLLQVAAHEFGHVLGLLHSDEPGAIMSAYYSFSYPLELSHDDRRGIQFLYGRRPEPPSPTPPPLPPRKETNEILLHPDACLTDFDAASVIRGELFFFKSGYVWRIRDGRLESGYPALASRHWRGIPDNVDAAFEDEAGNICFFQGNSYWVFDTEMRVRGPESVQALGLPATGVKAALRWGRDPDFNTYLFGSGGYWRYSPRRNRLESPYPRAMSDWGGIPADVDATFRDAYGYAHIIRGRQYWKLDPVSMNSLEGYPRYVGVDFFGCGNV
ncbi:stromelysin-3 [Corythoichthys intestinalis]|uniref:stromelysin-3 n=1 Tax=Corythoichthys intestinalis TaxID=161448 RepID=UPI0025A4DA05|nr:stromelysin-3 [Corythoichthys intestinalis]